MQADTINQSNTQNRLQSRTQSKLQTANKTGYKAAHKANYKQQTKQITNSKQICSQNRLQNSSQEISQNKSIKAKEDKTINLREELEKQNEWLESLIRKNSISLKASNTDKEKLTLHVSKRKNGYQYYIEEKEGKLRYIRAEERELARRTAQQDYDLSVRKILLQLHSRLTEFIRIYDTDRIANACDNLSEGRKKLIKPVILTDEEYVRLWREKKSRYSNIYPEPGKYMTESGEYVRSKSEKILADLFNKYSIPYIYEASFETFDGKTVYPDFTLLNIRTRQTVIWEHFGLVNEGEYAVKTLQKIMRYEKSGLKTGYTFLFSMESGEDVLDINQIETTIRQNLI
ncbi:MAG: hypothetical protein K5886_11690 [Lachnospiraceae bacterium]|nr:hypothetical protein [Lachnospiraceae bacterium]